jgi:hypothetical protein
VDGGGGGGGGDDDDVDIMWAWKGVRQSVKASGKERLDHYKLK